MDFTTSLDHSLFVYRTGDHFLALLIYVDDLVLTSSSPVRCCTFKHYLHQCFKLKNLGPLKYFLGIEVARSPHGLFLCQRKYALDILSESGMLGAKPVAFPMEQSHRLTTESGSPIADPSRYRRPVGRLLYLTITRPDLTYSVHILSQFMQDPRQGHWGAAMRLLRYLNSCLRQGILLPVSNSLQLQSYCDFDWANCPITPRSVTGYLLKLGPALVSWKTNRL